MWRRLCCAVCTGALAPVHTVPRGEGVGGGQDRFLCISTPNYRFEGLLRGGLGCVGVYPGVLDLIASWRDEGTRVTARGHAPAQQQNDEARGQDQGLWAGAAGEGGGGQRRGYGPGKGGCSGYFATLGR